MKVSSLLLIILICLEACVSLKSEIKHAGGQDEAIHNAILDISNTNKFYKKYSAFSVWFYDTLYKPVLEKRDDRNYAWIDGEPYDGLIAVRISGESGYQFVLTLKAKVGSIGILPSRFIEKNGKLFYWWDDNYPFTDTGLALLKKYHLLKDDSTSSSLSISIDESKKGAHYYFCRNNLSMYKKKITNIAIGYYKPPVLYCDN